MISFCMIDDANLDDLIIHLVRSMTQFQKDGFESINSSHGKRDLPKGSFV
jgi:hypothetical protein